MSPPIIESQGGDTLGNRTLGVDGPPPLAHQSEAPLWEEAGDALTLSGAGLSGVRGGSLPWQDLGGH